MARERGVSKPSLLGVKGWEPSPKKAYGKGVMECSFTRLLLTFPIYLSSFKQELVADTCALAAGACILFSPRTALV